MKIKLTEKEIARIRFIRRGNGVRKPTIRPSRAHSQNENRRFDWRKEVDY